MSKCKIRQLLLCQRTNRRAKFVQTFTDQRPHLNIHKRVKGLDREGCTPEDQLCSMLTEPLIAAFGCMLQWTSSGSSTNIAPSENWYFVIISHAIPWRSCPKPVRVDTIRLLELECLVALKCHIIQIRTNMPRTLHKYILIILLILFAQSIKSNFR